VKASLYLVLAALFWSGNFVVGQEAVGSMTPVELTFWRWMIAALPLLAMAQMVDKPDWRDVLRRWPTLLLLGALGMCGYTLLLYAALQHTSALNASLITAANPALIVILAIFILGEWPGALGWAGIGLGLAGVLLVLTGGDFQRLLKITFNLGEMLMLGAITAWSLYTIIARRLPIPAITATAVQVALATIILAPVAVATGAHLPETAAASWSLAYIAVFPSLGAYLLWNQALKTTSPGTAGNYLNLMVLFTAAITFLLGRTISGPQILGGLLVVGGVLLTSARRSGHSRGVPAREGGLRGMEER
jgi:drug/metabolite transporter (DMT)-like permease